MTMKKSAVFSLMMLVFAAPAAYAALTELPDGYLTGWGGKSSYNLNLGGGQMVQGRVEFGVYNTEETDFEAPGGRKYLYAYQIFNDGPLSASAIAYFSIVGINPEAIVSADDIEARDSGGVMPTDSYFSLTKEKAVFEFADGALVVGEKSAYLLIGSDAAPIVGSYVFSAPANDELPVPGDDGNDNTIPEPATLVLLLAGALLSMKKRR